MDSAARGGLARGREWLRAAGGGVRHWTPPLHRRRRPPQGAHPGALAPPDEAVPARLHVLHYGADACEEPGLRDPAALARLARHEGRVTWIDVVGLGDVALLEGLADAFGIHPLALADVVNVGQRPKADAYEDHMLLVTRMARVRPEGGLELEQVSVVLGPGWVITFQELEGDVFQPVRERIRSGARIRRAGADYLAYALVDSVIDGYFPVIETLGEDIERLEERVTVDPSPQTLRRIHAVRRTLLVLHRAQWAQRDALGTLLRDEDSPFGEAVRPYLRDAHDHAFQTLDLIETFRDMTVGLMDVYLSSVSQRMNEVMKTLTVVATIFIPLTFLAGVYGMNFEYMPELHWRWGYPAVWVAMGVIAVALLAWFRWRGWVGGDGEDPPPPG